MASGRILVFTLRCNWPLLTEDKLTNLAMKISTQVFLLSFGSLTATSSAFAALNSNDLNAYAGGHYLAAEGLRQASVFAEDQLTAAGGLQIGVGYGDYRVDSAGDRLFDADYSVFSGTLGYVHDFDGLKIGGSFSYLTTDFKSTGTGNNQVGLKTDGNGWVVALGGAKDWDRLGLIVQGGFGVLSLDSKRETAGGVKNSNYDAPAYYLLAELSYDLVATDGWNVTPSVELGYVATETDAFTETNSPDFASVGKLKDNVPYAELAVDVEYLGFGSVVPFVGLGLWQDLGSDSMDLDARDSIGDPFKFEVSDVARTVFTGTLGASVEVSERFSLGAAAGYQAGDKLQGYNLALTGLFSF